MSYKINKTVPVPEDFGSGAKMKYPLRRMEVGDSFFVPIGPGETEDRLVSRISSACYRIRPHRFTTKRVKGGARCWRIE